jgi:hypothetical protein
MSVGKFAGHVKNRFTVAGKSVSGILPQGRPICPALDSSSWRLFATLGTISAANTPVTLKFALTYTLSDRSPSRTLRSLS